MKSAITFLFLCIPLLMGLPHMSQAQNRGTAYAIPMSGISIDGSVEDWPEGMIETPIDWVSPRFHNPVPPEGPEDFSANFRVGYNIEENVVYIAVVVTDEDIVVNPLEQANLRNQDACGVYIDADHSGGGKEVEGHQLYIMVPGDGKWTRNQDANPSLNKGDTKVSGMKAAYSISANNITYEWEIPLFDSYPDRPHQLKAGETIGLDFLVCDADAGDLANFVLWTPGAGKSRTADLFGDLVFLESYDELGTITGIVTLANNQTPLAGKRVDIFHDGERWETVETDADGRYFLKLPAGIYTVHARKGQGFLPAKETKIEIHQGMPSTTDIIVSPIVLPKKFELTLDKYKTMKAYRDVTNIQMDFKQQGMEQKITSEHIFIFERPNRLKIALLTNMPSGMEQEVFSNGEELITYMKKWKQFKVEDAPANFDQKSILDFQSVLANSFLVSSDPGRKIKSTLGGLTKVGNERLDGQPTEVIELNLSLADLEEGISSDSENANLFIPVKIWIGKRDNLIHKLHYSLDMENLMAEMNNGDDTMDDVFKGMVLQITEKHADIEIDPALSMSDFTFNPPEDARKVEQFSPPGRPEPEPSPLIGEKAPDFTLVDLHSEALKLSDIKNKVVLIDFWATWCGPCVKAMPMIQSLHDIYKEKEVLILGINAWERDSSNVSPFLEAHGITYRILLDTKDEVISSYGVKGIPTFFLVDKNGIIRHVHRGVPSDNSQLQKEIETLLKE